MGIQKPEAGASGFPVAHLGEREQPCAFWLAWSLRLRIESICQPYIGGIKEVREINAEYTAPFVR